tara:strand:- start:2684 stop:4879 length:2196 start_codon:yes stop_codon:yes gene_type:complete
MTSNNEDGYKVQVSDEDLNTLLDYKLEQSSASFLDTSELSDERQKSTYEYAMIPQGHLKPQGVSRIVSSDTVEAIEGYTAVLSELLFDNNKLAKFKAYDRTPLAYHKATAASELLNHCLFSKNRGWSILNTWLKSALMWKLSAVTWTYASEEKVSFEEYEVIDSTALDVLLSDPEITTTGDIYLDEQTGNYLDVRLKRTKVTNKVVVSAVPPETLRVGRGATGIHDASFVGFEEEMTRSEIRERWPEAAEGVDWSSVDSNIHYAMNLNTDSLARKQAIGTTLLLGSGDDNQLEATESAVVLRCWVYVDRDGDGIAELKYIVRVGDTILEEEDADHIQVATFTPFEIPFELEGLSMSDMVRPSTLASTAILRGFVENTYLTNYAPKIADPNVVDFSALQNMKPKQIIASNGNPQGAVASLPPEQISTGTVPLLQFLQGHKEQATGLSKAAQGLNDALYVSGNSEAKVSQVQSAAQLRIQFIARRFMETGGRELLEGIYRTMQKEMRGGSVGDYTGNQRYLDVLINDLPGIEYMSVEADVGDASNQTQLQKLQMIGQQILPALRDAGAGAVVAPTAASTIAVQAFDALGLDPLDYLIDINTDEFKKKAEEGQKSDQEAQAKAKQLEELTQKLAVDLQKANIDYTNVQAQNAIQDNLKQLMVALDKSEQEWSKLALEAGKEQQPMPTKTNIDVLYAKAQGLVADVMVTTAGATDASNLATPQEAQPMGPSGVLG